MIFWLDLKFWSYFMLGKGKFCQQPLVNTVLTKLIYMLQPQKRLKWSGHLLTQQNLFTKYLHELMLNQHWAYQTCLLWWRKKLSLCTYFILCNAFSCVKLWSSALKPGNKVEIFTARQKLSKAPDEAAPISLKLEFLKFLGFWKKWDFFESFPRCAPLLS